MKNIILAFFLFFTFTGNIFSQETAIPPIQTTSITNFETFPVRIYTEAQSAWNKKVPVFVEFTATMDSDKVQIDWDAPSGVFVEPKYPQFFSVKSGQKYTYKALIKPEKGGTYNIGGNVIVWQYNTNYASPGSTVISFSDNLLTIPVASEYTVGVWIKWVIFILLIAVLGYIGYLYAIKSKKKFDRWFNLPD
jgi:hypothetical protein